MLNDGKSRVGIQLPLWWGFVLGGFERHTKYHCLAKTWEQVKYPWVKEVVVCYGGGIYSQREKNHFSCMGIRSIKPEEMFISTSLFLSYGGIECTYFMTGRSHATQFLKGAREVKIIEWREVMLEQKSCAWCRGSRTSSRSTKCKPWCVRLLKNTLHNSSIYNECQTQSA